MLQLPAPAPINASRVGTKPAPDFAAILTELEPLVVRYFKARQTWAAAVMRTPRPTEWTEETTAAYGRALDARGANPAEDALSYLFERIEHLAGIVEPEPATDLVSMKAHLLVALWRVSPACASTRELKFQDEQSFEALFHACASFCGLSPFVATIERGFARTPKRKGSRPDA